MLSEHRILINMSIIVYFHIFNHSIDALTLLDRDALASARVKVNRTAILLNSSMSDKSENIRSLATVCMCLHVTIVAFYH